MSRPPVVARWRMTANGIGLDEERAGGGDPRAEIERQAAQGAAEVVLEGDADLIAAAFADGLVDRVVCHIEPALALDPFRLVTGGEGAAHMDEAVRLVDVRLEVEASGAVRIEGKVLQRRCNAHERA